MAVHTHTLPRLSHTHADTSSSESACQPPGLDTIDDLTVFAQADASSACGSSAQCRRFSCLVSAQTNAKSCMRQLCPVQALLMHSIRSH